MDEPKQPGKGAYSGFGDEWRAAELTPAEARKATDWVEAKIDRRSMLTGKERVEDVRDIMWQLEKDGEILV
ncbi:MAG: heterodisulfide reductase subunit B, partial [Alphaproteobacteria bacterium]